jgi:hypothetical protein
LAGRSERQARKERDALDEYIRSVSTTTGGGAGADQLATAKRLLDEGALTPDEYEVMKRKVLA